MSFSWDVRDKDGKDLLKEFDINGQAIGLGDSKGGWSLDEIRRGFATVPYGDKLADAARDKIGNVQEMVRRNIAYYEGPAHEDCPCCTCKREQNEPFGLDMEQAKRFVSIPLNRVHRATGGW